jgi:hypothetical protein
VKKAGLRLAALLSAAVAGAWSADYAADGAPSYFNGAPASPAASADGTLELKWDSGFGRWWLIWYTGADTWIGNDFDVGTVSTYAAVEAIKTYVRYDWPSIGWEGFRLGIFAYEGGVPGSLLWGPKYFLPTGVTGSKECPVNWTLPPGVYEFIAAHEQFYNWPPYGDAFCIDNNPTFMGHSWSYSNGVWEPFKSERILPYRNLMIRVVMSDETVNVSPTSVGRVKALYY